MWINMLTTTGLGAVIGGYTNHLAIKMLFRPRNPVYIGKFRVPFTPGLIPKRRDELAFQLGRMVVDHLLTPEGIQKKFTDAAFQNNMITSVQAQAMKLFETEQTVRERAALLGFVDIDKKAAMKLENVIQSKVDDLWETYGTQSWTDVLPASTREKIEEMIPNVAEFLVHKGIAYFESEDGKKRLAKMIEDFFASRGTLLNMIGMFFGNEGLVERVQPEVVKFLSQDGTKQFLCELIRKEWERIEQSKVEKIEAFISKDDAVQFLCSVVKAEQIVTDFLDQPLCFVLAPYRDKVLDEWIPRMVERVTNWLLQNLDTVMKNLHLAEIVEAEVATFPIERVEELVLSITSSELRMITYLGALLGGMIGLIQGILLLFLS